MRRVDLYIPEEDINYLKARTGSVSEHIRYAISQYIHRLQQEEVRLTQNGSTSASVINRVGDENG